MFLFLSLAFSLSIPHVRALPEQDQHRNSFSKKGFFFATFCRAFVDKTMGHMFFGPLGAKN